MKKNFEASLTEEINVRAFSEKLYNNLKNFSFLMGQTLSPKFLEIAGKLRIYLIEVKNKFDKFDKSSPSPDQQIAFINREKRYIFNSLNDHFTALSNLIIAFSKEEYRAHQLFIQKELYDLIGTTPFNKHIYEKPLGYPGDYIMMNYLYEDGYAGDSSYEKLIHRYSCELPISRANINRKAFFKNEIVHAIDKFNDEARIASIACGPAKELIEVLKEKSYPGHSMFTFFDFEKTALEQIQTELGVLRDKFNLKFINENILTLVKRSRAEGIIGNQHFIYCAGLIDYMSDKLSAKIIETLASILEPDGRLIVGNVNVGNQFASYTEMLGEWNINYRSENQMLALASTVKDARRIYTMLESGSEMNVFLIIER